MTSTATPPATSAGARDRAAHDRKVRSLLRPQSVAVIGASGTPTRIGGIIVSLLQRYKFPGQVFPVNPKYEEIQGFPCYASLDDIPAKLRSTSPSSTCPPTRSTTWPVPAVSAASRPSSSSAPASRSSAGTGCACSRNSRQRRTRTAWRCADRTAPALPPSSPTSSRTARRTLSTSSTSRRAPSHCYPPPAASATRSSPTARNATSASGTSSASAMRRSRPPPTTSTCWSTTRTSGVLGNIEAVRDPGRFFGAADRAAAAARPIVVLKGGRSEAGRHCDHDAHRRPRRLPAKPSPAPSASTA